MKRLILKALILGVALPGILLTSACTGKLIVYSQNEQGITLRVTDHLDYNLGRQKIYDKANQHCKSYGKSAILTVNAKGGRTHTFECR